MFDQVLNTPLYSVTNFLVLQRGAKSWTNPICEERVDCIGAGNEMVTYDLKWYWQFRK